MNKKNICKSKCLNLPKEKCRKGCIYTKKYKCRLSGKYMMDPNNHCKVFLKKQFYTKKKSLKKEIQKKQLPKKINILNNNIKNNSYSPDINKYLISSRNSEKFDIFSSIKNCIQIKDNNYTLNKKLLYYYLKPRIMLENGSCVDYTNSNAQKLFLDNLSKHNVIDFKKIKAPRQSYHNCWFNTGIMMNYVSDKGRKFNKYFRQYMITGKLKGFIDNKMKGPLFTLNIVIESILSGNKLATFMNTNDIIRKIYKCIPKQFEYFNNIYDKNVDGNPYTYIISLLNYLSDKNYNKNFLDGKDFFKLKNKDNIKDDILWVELFDHESNINYKCKDFKSKNGYTYTLDSMLLRDKTKTHFCCFITINNKEYMYDGASSPNIIEFKWKDYINRDIDIKINNDSLTFNMRKGYQVLNFYRS